MPIYYEIDHVPDILDGIPPGTNEYHYGGIDHYKQILNLKSNRPDKGTDFIIFFDVNEDVFTNKIQTLEEKPPISAYDPIKSILLLKMTTQVHEQAAQGITAMIQEEILEMGLSDNMCFIGSAQVQTQSRQKKADQEYVPVELPKGRTRKWPSAVVETGYSESKSKLQTDAQWWLAESNGEVRTALTISVHQKKEEIVLQKWEMMERPTRENPDRHAPVMMQQVVMSRRPGEGAIHISNAPLRIAFESLFLRPAGESERDILFTEKSLKSLATKVWVVQQL
ncbi:hypothetical protein ASPWEDRAFT_40360 [Aspergillus wentii DTO 134E9]|uniref:Uncharacterized protein n=1 Tax=Aspergillus wentii DTO 134E9 TaxID=1073089 RepID=A0A1L9RJQ6_ASPWE|nr:uncharacterized protein ASPWEDRAFT_40360 [Aspergillus wentii DTO 134E9]OJJ35176.1 hypothetical protein ASPWEDRAFT_40360 [Aspergillus wentii DTO 134E9]